MRLHRLVETFEAESQRCAGLAPLFTLALDAAQELGFDRLAMVHGLWFRRRDAGLNHVMDTQTAAAATTMR